MSDDVRWKRGGVSGRDASATLSGVALFQALWNALAELLGTAATAVLVERAARRALSRSQELADLAIERVDGNYEYMLPRSFELTKGPPAALRDLAAELRVLLAEMTGDVGARHLGQHPALRTWAAGMPAP
ncbi:MAG: hypothetical protein HZB56_10030 [Deltaproteobacteria bacterium]|nr:hypothetical protein [Deltaproteobacteria bacterium]